MQQITAEQFDRIVAAGRPKDAPKLPAQIEKPDFTQLIETVVEGVTRTIADGYEDDDLGHYIQEAALTAIYGPEYWPWRRAQRL